MPTQTHAPITAHRAEALSVMSQPRPQPSPPRSVVLRAARRIVDMTKRAYPMILVLTIFAVFIAATIALRLLIWLPMWIGK